MRSHANNNVYIYIIIQILFLMFNYRIVFASQEEWHIPGQTFKPVSVTFVVTDSSNNVPLNSAIVKINKESQYTDNSGRVTFKRPDIFEVGMTNDSGNQLIPCGGRYTGRYAVTTDGYESSDGEFALSCEAPCPTIYVSLSKISYANDRSVTSYTQIQTNSSSSQTSSKNKWNAKILTGTIRVFTNPSGAQLLIDNELTQLKTPVSLDLQGGKHIITALYNGISRKKEINVQIEKTTEIKLDLTDEINQAEKKRNDEKLRIAKEQSLEQEKERQEKAKEKTTLLMKYGYIELNLEMYGSCADQGLSVISDEINNKNSAGVERTIYSRLDFSIGMSVDSCHRGTAEKKRQMLLVSKEGKYSITVKYRLWDGKTVGGKIQYNIDIMPGRKNIIDVRSEAAINNPVNELNIKYVDLTDSEADILYETAKQIKRY